VTPPGFGVCGEAATPIHQVQGSGLASPLAGSSVVIEGVVVANFQGAGQIGGYFVQEEEAQGDSDPLTSEGLYIFDNANPAAVGATVRVQGTVTEFFTLTELSPATSFANCGAGSLPTTAPVTLPVTAVSDFERFEGMKVTIPQTLYISEFFNFDRFGEMVLTTERQFQPTAVVEPGPAAQARALELQRARITLDDGSNAQNPVPLRHPNGNDFSLSNRFRGGDTLHDVTGVMHFAFDLYRIQPTQGAIYTAANPRPASPADVDGSLRVAAANVLNYFTTLDTNPGQNNGPNICGPLANLECRGANTALELTRQRDKIIAALSEIEADVFGLMEIENHPTDQVTADLVAGLNDELGAGTYDYVATGGIGTDAIRLAIIYKPSKVAPVGDFAVLTTVVDPRFRDNLNRPVLAQTFQEVATGAVFTVAVNHLKSKGSDCNAVGDPDTGDGSGNCNVTRTLAAQALVDWLATDPTGSGDEDFMIIGDLNAYDKEAPIDAIAAGSDDALGTVDDFADLQLLFEGEFAYSFLFDGQLGYLDHALANQALLSQVTGVTTWHNNADEPDVLDYNTDFGRPLALYDDDAFRASDHDPVVVGLNLTAPDTDGDGVPDAQDNCDKALNPGQQDSDGDGQGGRLRRRRPPARGLRGYGHRQHCSRHGRQQCARWYAIQRPHPRP
jgi:predicted extracellular nuclease